MGHISIGVDFFGGVVVPVLLRKLVVLASVQVQEQAHNVKLEVPLPVDLQDFVGVFFEQDENAFLFQIPPKRVAASDGYAGLANLSAAVEVEDYLFR